MGGRNSTKRSDEGSLAIDRVLWRVTENQMRGVRWTLLSAVTLLFCRTRTDTSRRKPKATTSLGSKLGYLSVSASPKLSQLTLRRLKLEFTDSSTCLGSIFWRDNGANTDIGNRLSKAKATFARPMQVWKADQYSTETKLNI